MDGWLGWMAWMDGWGLLYFASSAVLLTADSLDRTIDRGVNL